MTRFILITVIALVSSAGLAYAASPQAVTDCCKGLIGLMTGHPCQM